MSLPAVLSIEDDYEALIQFLYLAPVGLIQASTDGEIVMINPISAQLLMPISRDGNLSNIFDALAPVAPDLRHLCAAFDKPHGMVCDGMRIQITSGVPGKSDPQILALSLLKLDQKRLMAMLTDVTLQVKRERQLKQNEAWFNAILTGITDYALISLNSGGRIEDWNASIGRLTGHTREAVLGQTCALFYQADATTPHSLLDRLHDADANGWSLDEGYCVKADGSRFWASTMIAPLRECQELESRGLPVPDGEAAYCLVMRDISDKRDASEAHRKATSCDYLTGLSNRRTFFEAAGLEIERLQRSPRPLSLILFDADHFKTINDRFGHPAGDAVLRQLAVALTETFRQVDVVARVGGEEFAVLLPSTDRVGARAVAERLRELVAMQPVEVDGVQIAYTISGGVATMDDTVQGLDALMKRADQALYAAKKRGRNCIECWSAG